jgi:cell division protein FtsL
MDEDGPYWIETRRTKATVVQVPKVRVSLRTENLNSVIYLIILPLIILLAVIFISVTSAVFIVGNSIPRVGSNITSWNYKSSWDDEASLASCTELNVVEDIIDTELLIYPPSYNSTWISYV